MTVLEHFDRAAPRPGIFFRACPLCLDRASPRGRAVTTIAKLSGAWFYPAEEVDKHLAHHGDFIVEHPDSNPLSVHFNHPGHMDVTIGQDDCDTNFQVTARKDDVEVLGAGTCVEAGGKPWTWKSISATEVEVFMYDETMRLKRLDKSREQLIAEDAQDLTTRTIAELVGTYSDGHQGKVTFTAAGELKTATTSSKVSVDWCGLGEDESRSGVCVVLSGAKGGPAVPIRKTARSPTANSSPPRSSTRPCSRPMARCGSGASSARESSAALGRSCYLRAMRRSGGVRLACAWGLLCAGCASVAPHNAMFGQLARRSIPATPRWR